MDVTMNTISLVKKFDLLLVMQTDRLSTYYLTCYPFTLSQMKYTPAVHVMW